MRCIRILTLVVIITTISLTTVSAQWPVTCIDLNDAFERLAGRTENVAIYQNVHQDQAEERCRDDHREAVQRAFAWAFNGELSPQYLKSPQAHSAFDLVRRTAIARGAEEDMAQVIAMTVIAENTWPDYLRGNLSNIQFGDYPCYSKGDDCPLALPPRYQTLNWRWSGVEEQDDCWGFSTSLTIRNNTPDQMRFSWIAIIPLDKYGNELFRIPIYRVNVGAYSERPIEESWQFCNDAGERPDTLGIDFEENRNA